MTLYRVVGRYMTGTEVTAYHLVDQSGNSLKANKEVTLSLIGRGQIVNMRVQLVKDEKTQQSRAVIRGKGINLNNLPIYDNTKNQMRNNSTNHGGQGTSSNPMGSYSITKRIMFRTNCVGYVIKDISGVERSLSRENVLKLASNMKIVNAVLRKYKDNDGKPVFVLRGIGCKISELPAVFVDQNGNIIDDKIHDREYTLRCTRVNRGGMIYNELKNTTMAFKPKDYLVITPNGALTVIKSEDAFKMMHKTTDTHPVCDLYIDNLKNFPVELFGNPKIYLDKSRVRDWTVVGVRITK